MVTGKTMQEKNIQIFLAIITHYFQQLSEESLVIGVPYLLEKTQPKVYDYTGVIGISGITKGVVCFSGTHGLLSCVLDAMGESDKSEDNLIDLVGEIANTIAGNARKAFGKRFHVSIPFVFKGSPQSIILPKDGRSFIIPMTWRTQMGEIIVCLQH